MKDLGNKEPKTSREMGWEVGRASLADVIHKSSRALGTG